MGEGQIAQQRSTWRDFFSRVRLWDGGPGRRDPRGDLLWAEARLGELLKDLPSHVGRQAGKGGMAKTLPPGMTWKQSHHAQRLGSPRSQLSRPLPKTGDLRWLGPSRILALGPSCPTAGFRLPS